MKSSWRWQASSIPRYTNGKSGWPKCVRSSRCRSLVRPPAALVTEGRIARVAHVKIRLVRDSVVQHEGRIGSLRRFKDDVTEVKNGLECGIAFERYADIKAVTPSRRSPSKRFAATV